MRQYTSLNCGNSENDMAFFERTLKYYIRIKKRFQVKKDKLGRKNIRYSRKKRGGMIVKKKEKEIFHEEGEDVLVIDENTIYEIDMHCVKCKQKTEETKEKQMEKKG